MGSSDFGSLSVGPSQNHSQWSSRRRHRHRCATVPDSHRVHRDLIGAAPCTRRRLAPVHATRDVPFRQPLVVAARQPRVAGASGTWNAAARGPGGAAGAVPRTPVAIRFDKTPRATPRGRHHDPQHICHGDERATPRIADKIHHSAPGTATGWPPPMGRGRSQEATTAKTVDAADERMRTRSRHRNVPRDGWYFAPPWYFGSTSRPVPHHVANPTISDTSATNVSSCARHSGTWTWRARPQQYFAPRGISVRQGTSCHTRWQTPRSLTHLPRRQTSWPKSERWRHGVEHQTPGRTHSHVGMTRQPRANQVTKQAQSRRITDGRARSTPCTRAQQQRSCPHHPPRANILAEGSQPQRASPSHVPDEITGTTWPESTEPGCGSVGSPAGRARVRGNPTLPIHRHHCSPVSSLVRFSH